MRREAGRRRILLILLLCFLLVGTTACVRSDIDLLIEFIQEWARAKKIHPTNPDGSINWEGTLNVAARATGGSTGDPEADAAIDAATVVKNIKEADELMDKGRQKRDATAMDAAIKKRPGDWSYRNSRAALALERGDKQGWTDQVDKATQLAGEQGESGELRQQRDLAGELEAVTRRNFPQSREQCRDIYGALADVNLKLKSLTRNESYNEQVDHYLRLRSHC